MILAPAAGVARYEPTLQVDPEDLVVARHGDKEHAVDQLQVPWRVESPPLQGSRSVVPLGVLIPVADDRGHDTSGEVGLTDRVVARIRNEQRLVGQSHPLRLQELRVRGGTVPEARFAAAEHLQHHTDFRAKRPRSGCGWCPQ